MRLKSSQTLAEALQRASVFLEKRGYNGELARQYWLMAFDWTLTDLVSSLREVPSIEQLEQFESILERIVQDEPIQYILGYADFMGERFIVTEDTLIPREDTAGLVELALEYLKDNPTARVLDIGTGTGIIAISLAKRCPTSQIVGSDISYRALNVARHNQAKHQTHIIWCESDVFSNIDASEPFDVIISNPPYISESEIDVMDRSVLKYEPHSALFATEAGLAIYRTIAEQARAFLQVKGVILLEIGYKQGRAVRELFQEAFPEAIVQVKQDLNGLERYVVVDLRGGK